MLFLQWPCYISSCRVGVIVTLSGVKVGRNFPQPYSPPCACGGSRLNLNGGDEVPEVQGGLVQKYPFGHSNAVWEGHPHSLGRLITTIKNRGGDTDTRAEYICVSRTAFDGQVLCAVDT